MKDDGQPARPTDDRDADNATRVRQAKRDILERAGGTYDTGEVAELLGVGSDEVRRRLREGSLLAYESSPGEYRFPRAQFTGTGILPGLEDVLAAMNIDAAWMRIQLLMDHDIIGALRAGHIEDAVLAARSYLPAPPGDE